MNNTIPNEVSDNQLSKAEDLHSDKGYTVSTHEKQAEFAKQRNYEWDEWKPIE